MIILGGLLSKKLILVLKMNPQDCLFIRTLGSSSLYIQYYVTGYEKSTGYDNTYQLTSIQKTFFLLAFSETFIIKLTKVKISADLGKGFIGKKRVLVMAVYRSNSTKLHLEHSSCHFYDDTTEA